MLAIVRALGCTTLVLAALLATTAAAKDPTGDLTTQDPASAQPKLPKPMPSFTDPTVPMAPAGAKSAKRGTTKTATHKRRGSRLATSDGLDRPALANVELQEALPHPPQPPHVTIPVPAYPLEDFVTAFTPPPPPVVCRPTRYDRFKPDPNLIGERPVLCTADNP